LCLGNVLPFQFKIGGGGSTGKPLPRIKAASKQSAKKRTNKTKAKIKRK
jgi:hypothetical protein